MLRFAQPTRLRWLGVFVWAAGLGVQAQPHGGRLEPSERARLRHELREQAWGARSAEHAARHAAWQEGGQVRPAGAQPPGLVGNTDVRPRLSPVLGGQPHPDELGGGLTDDPRQLRLSPDERRHLRRELHEERRRRRDHLESTTR